MAGARDDRSSVPEGAVAIIGMAGRFPGARTLDQLWHNLSAGVESVRFLSREEMRALGVPEARIADPAWVPAVAMPDGIEEFDAPFFGISHREAEVLDPQQRLFLELCWAALEDAGRVPDSGEGLVAVYAGVTTSTYLLYNLARNAQVQASVDPLQLIVGNAVDSLTTRVSYRLNLKGPSHAVQCACSSSAVAVHQACQSLLGQECDLALAGGVSLNVAQRGGYRFQEDSILAPDGHCRAFDAAAHGTIFGGGAGLVVLKRLEDAVRDRDTIRAVIRGSAVNNDGANKVGYTAPSVEGQAEVIAEALAVADVEADSIGYLEGHGTGTVLGDPIEIQALTKAYRAHTGRTGFCALGTIKSNLGHLDIAAGIAGLIKTVLVLEREEIPPSLHFKRPNPRIDFAASPVYVNRERRDWKRGAVPRRAAVSSFGFGGTNAHLILEEAPPLPRRSAALAAESPCHLLVWSAKSEPAAGAAGGRLAAHFAAHPETDLESASYTLLAGRRTFAHRRFAVVDDTVAAARLAEGIGVVSAFEPVEPRPRPVAFLFPGQGAQHAGMGRGLYASEPVFRAEIDRCAQRLEPLLGLDLRSLLFPPPGGEAEADAQLARTRLTQPALFAVEHSLARLWMARGVEPTALLGHSIGEYVAACLAGVFALDDALALVAERGRLIDELPAGAMLAVPLAEPEARALARGGVSLAAINEPGRAVLAGPLDEVAALERRLREEGIAARRLHTSHAFHSALMEGAVAPFVARVRQVRLSPPAIPFVSNVSGTWIGAEEATDPEYWGRQLRAPVRFAAGVAALVADRERILLEVGPGTTLATLAARQSEGCPAIASLPHPKQAGGTADDRALATAVGRLWLCGHQLDPLALFAGRAPRRVPLPTYPFEPHRYWIEPSADSALPLAEPESGAAREGLAPAGSGAGPSPEPAAGPRAAAQTLHPRPPLATPFAAPRGEVEEAVAAVWRSTLGLREVGIHDSFLDLGGDSLLATQLMSRLREEFGVDLPMERLFDEPTVAAVATALVAARAEGAGAEDLERLLREIQELSEDDLERELASGAKVGDEEAGSRG